jgi:hypothetical protein
VAKYFRDVRAGGSFRQFISLIASDPSSFLEQVSGAPARREPRTAPRVGCRLSLVCLPAVSRQQIGALLFMLGAQRQGAAQAQ